MTQLTHGGDWAGYRAQYGHDALDFSANVSPLGLPQGVANAIAAALPHADRYPDPLCRALRAKLAPHEGIPAESILCGNGAADLIFRLAWAAKPRTALVTAPTFAEYAAALESAGCAVRRHFLQAEVDFAVTDSILSSITPEVDMVFLCQPNNPTGQLTPLPLVERILRRCEACGALLVVDECFLDFLPDCDALTAKALLDSKNLLILKAFTKLYGMAGVRLGYCLCANTALLEAMQAAGQPWAVSSLAQAAGLAALDETAYVAQVRALIAQQRPRLTAGLRALGLRVLDGRANYLLFQGPETLGDALRQRGVPPTLAIIRVGRDPGGLAYEKGAASRCAKCGIALRRIPLDDAASLPEVIRSVNDDPAIHGCLLLRPLADKAAEEAAGRLLAPDKDVDGMTPGSLAGLLTGRGGFAPCTAQACLELLDYYGVDPAGRRAVGIGRSLVVGQPAALLLQRQQRP